MFWGRYGGGESPKGDGCYCKYDTTVQYSFRVSLLRQILNIFMVTGGDKPIGHGIVHGVKHTLCPEAPFSLPRFSLRCDIARVSPLKGEPSLPIGTLWEEVRRYRDFTQRNAVMLCSCFWFKLDSAHHLSPWASVSPAREEEGLSSDHRY